MKGKLIREKYRILKTLGQNAFSETFLAGDERKWVFRRYIIKKLRPILGNPDVDDIKHLFYQEASILKRLSGNHPQIPRLYEYFFEGEEFYIVREWIDGLTLKQKVEQQGKLDPAEVEEILDSILSFLNYIHSYGIVYRQLKPSTIMLRENRLAIASQKKFLPIPIYFGGVKELEATIDNSKQYVAISHRQEYISPEQKQGNSVFASDLYSLGMTAIYLLTGKNPAEFPVDSGTKKLLWHQESDFNIHLVRVIERAICPNVSERFASAEEMLQALHSPPVTLAMPTPKKEPQQLMSSEAKIITVLCSMGIGVLGLTFIILNIDFAQFDHGDSDEFARAYQTETLLTDTLTPTEAISTSNSIPRTNKIPAFPLGMTLQDLTDMLGEPSMNSRGYWQNSRALMYQGVTPEKIALGYLTDTRTQSVRQAEIAFDSSVNLPVIQQQAQNLLQNNYSMEIEHYINQIYFNTSDRHEFEIDSNLKGVVQRNPSEYIYLAIWDSKFHK